MNLSPAQAELAELVRAAARDLSLLDAHDELKPASSIEVVELVLKLEALAGVRFPASAFRAGTFASVESVALWLERLKAERR
jgi:acyl carrier protein